MKKIVTKIAIAAAMLLPAQFAFSQSGPYNFSQSNPHDGLYMGVEGSYAKTRNKSALVIVPEVEGDGFYFEDDVISETESNPVYSAEGAGAGIFIGYRMSEGKFTLATEVSYAYNFVSNEIASGVAPNSPIRSYEITNEFGVTIMPGIWLNENLVLFGQIGFSQLQINGNAGAESFNNSDTGLIFGGGVQIYSTEQLSIRASYTRSTHNHKSDEGITIYEFVNGIDTPISVVDFEYNSKIVRDKFAVSLVYNF